MGGVNRSRLGRIRGFWGFRLQLCIVELLKTVFAKALVLEGFRDFGACGVHGGVRHTTVSNKLACAVCMTDIARHHTQNPKA